MAFGFAFPSSFFMFFVCFVAVVVAVFAVAGATRRPRPRQTLPTWGKPGK